MDRINELLSKFTAIAEHPEVQLNRYISEGKKVIGCFPYYVPEELVHASGMIPFGVWGCNGKPVRLAKEYFATFYCTLAQMILELGLSGRLNKLSGVIAPSLCDTLRPLTQNFRVGVPQIPFIFLAHPQNRRMECGIEFTISQYEVIKRKLEEISGVPISDDILRLSIRTFNKSRASRRKFSELAGKHPDAVTPLQRCAVLKSAYFMTREEYITLIDKLNAALEVLPEKRWDGIKIFTSGIIADSPGLLKIFDELNMAVASDDVAHESRAIRIDVPEDITNPVRALAVQFACQGNDTLLYDPDINTRPDYIVKKVKNSGAEGVVILMMPFCDPEEMEYPSLKKRLDESGIPSIIIGIDPQMNNYEQARTSLQTFTDIISTAK